MGRAKGSQCSDETRARMSAAAVKRWADPAYRERTIKQLVTAARARVPTPQEIECRIARLKAVPPERRSAASKKRWADPLYRATVSDAVRKSWRNDPRLIRPDDTMMALIHEYNDGPVGKKIAAINLGITVSTLDRILRDRGIVWKKSTSVAKAAPEVGHPPDTAARVAASVTASSLNSGGAVHNGAPVFLRRDAA